MVSRWGVIAWQSYTALQCHVLLALFPNASDTDFEAKNQWPEKAERSHEMSFCAKSSMPSQHSLCQKPHKEANWLDIAAISYQPTKTGKCLLYKQFWAVKCYCNNTTFPSTFTFSRCFYPKRLQVHSGYTFCQLFAGHWTHREVFFYEKKRKK